jgi:nucleoside diphosphate kinase
MHPGDFTFALIKPGVPDDVVSEILRMIRDGGLMYHSCAPSTLSSGEARQLYYEHIGKHFYDRNNAYITSGPSIKMLLVGPGAQPLWRNFIMPAIRDKWEEKGPRPERLHLNLVHGSDSPVAALREAVMLWHFPGRWR